LRGAFRAFILNYENNEETLRGGKGRLHVFVADGGAGFTTVYYLFAARLHLNPFFQFGLLERPGS
jgi:hypothetical protein